MANINMQRNLWTTEDVAHYLTISSDNLVYRLASRREIPFVRIGGKLLRFEPAVVENCLLPAQYSYPVVQAYTGKPVMRVAEIAAHFSVKTGLIYKMFNQGELPGRRVGGLWLASQHWLDLWIDDHAIYPPARATSQPTPDPPKQYYVLIQH